jgi:hypothetical protein
MVNEMLIAMKIEMIFFMVVDVAQPSWLWVNGHPACCLRNVNRLPLSLAQLQAKGGSAPAHPLPIRE